MGVNFFCTIAILTKTTNTMKLRNSFLIAAGIFFFAVAFINFAKAGDDGGENPDGSLSSEFNATTVYDTLCTAYLWTKYDANTGTINAVINESAEPPTFNHMLTGQLDGKKDVCVYCEGDICFPTKCSSLWDLAVEHGLM